MITAMLAGGAVGLGLWAIARGLRPPAEPLAAVLARVHPATHPAAPPAPGLGADPGWAELTRLAGRPLVRLLDRLGLQLGWPERELAVTGRSRERFMTEKATTALVGLLLPAAVTLLLAAVGIQVAVSVPAWAALALAIGGWFVPDVTIRQDAAERRREFRHTLGGFLDLTVIALAGGAGVEGALHDAAQAASDWAGARLRHALADARLRREPPWVALGRLGEQLGVAELVELAASVGLAGAEGAKVRASLLAKAASLRAHQLADLEADAHAATERMSLPVVVMLAGFLLFLGFPAVMRILAGTG